MRCLTAYGRRTSTRLTAAASSHAATFTNSAALPSAAGHPQRRKLYDSHIPTTPLQKLVLSVTSAFTVFLHPEREEMLATLGEVTGRDALRSIHAQMCADPVGARILAEKPVIRTATMDMQYLRALPADSFGRHYVTYMERHGFDTDGRSLVRFVDDPELAYVMRRHRELHDFWHTLFALPPTVLGELALKYVEMVHSKLPVSALSAFVGPLRLSSEERWLLMKVYVPWASRVSKKVRSLHCVMYEEELETPIDDLRQRLSIEVAPSLYDLSEYCTRHKNDKD